MENLALRQQLSVFKHRNRRPKLVVLDNLFWVLARRFWCDWQESLLVVVPETVVGWYRAGFRLYCSMLSKIRKQVRRSRIPGEVRDLILRIGGGEPYLGCSPHPRRTAHARLRGIRTKCLPLDEASTRDAELAQRGLAFLLNHGEAIAAMDFFTVPTVTFQLLYCFFIIRHDRRQIVHCNVILHPTSSWIVQQLREAFPYESATAYLLFDHDQKYGLEVLAAIRSLQITGVRTSIRSPWQNGVAERWVESCRRDLLDHIIAVNQRHLKRLLADYIRYHHDDRTHLGLRKETPGGRVRSAGRVAFFLICDSVACTIDMNAPHNRILGGS